MTGVGWLIPCGTTIGGVPISLQLFAVRTVVPASLYRRKIEEIPVTPDDLLSELVANQIPDDVCDAMRALPMV